MTTVEVMGRRWANLNGSHGNPHGHQALMNEWLNLTLVQCRATKASPVPTPCVITATVHRTTNGRSDAHNVTPTIKACVDGAVKAGLIPDDDDSHVAELRIRRGEKRPQPTITLQLEEA